MSYHSDTHNVDSADERTEDSTRKALKSPKFPSNRRIAAQKCKPRQDPLVHKKQRKFTCGECSFQDDSLAKLNHHQPVACTHCTKTFATPSTLARHKYVHGSRKYKCDHKDCTSSFSFKSELKRHKFVHRTHAAFKCHYPKCDRWYFSKEELVKHVRVHDGKIWKCQEEGCRYITPDKRLLQQHKRKHNDNEPYQCGVCGKKYKYHMQYSRHLKKDECEKVTVSA